MPALICDLGDTLGDTVDDLLSAACHRLAAAGEAVMLYRPLHPALAPVADLAALDAALDAEQVALLPAPLPAWVPAADCSRVLLVSVPLPALAGFAGPHRWSELRHRFQLPELPLLDQLFALGCESIELLEPAALADLSQSWISGRRPQTLILTAP